MNRMRALRALAAIAAMLAVFVAGQTPASAHYFEIKHGKDIVGMSADHSLGWICDNERDGHWVEASWFNGNRRVYEKDGGDFGCDYQSLPSGTYHIEICEENKGCNAWYDFDV